MLWDFPSVFRGSSNTDIGVLKNAWTDLHQIRWRHCQIIATHKFKNGEDIWLDFQNTAAHNRALLSDKAENRTF